MNWNGKTLHTMGDIVDAIRSCTTKEEAIAFRTLYESENPFARGNIGYATGYCSREEADRLMELFDCPHPFFGREHPAPEDAFQMGLKMAELSKKHGSAVAVQMMTNLKIENPWHVGAL